MIWTRWALVTLVALSLRGCSMGPREQFVANLTAKGWTATLTASGAMVYYEWESSPSVEGYLAVTNALVLDAGMMWTTGELGPEEAGPYFTWAKFYFTIAEEEALPEGSMTKSELRQLARFYLDQMTEGGWLEDSSDTVFDLDQALMMGLERYCREVRCSKAKYTISAVADRAIYSYSSFGVESANTASISVLAAANNTTAFTLLAAEPSGTTVDEHFVTITLKNTAGGPLTGAASTYTVSGTTAEGVSISEGVAFTVVDLTSVAAGASVTMTTSKMFHTVTGITPSAAQPVVTWQHSAGVAEQTAGDRLFDLSHAAYDEKPLTRRDSTWLDKWDREWRFAESGTPTMWLPWGESKFRLYRPPDGTLNLYIEGWETPDERRFARDGDRPEIQSADQYLISMFAAVMVAVRGSRDENLIRQNIFWPELKAGWQRAYKRIHNIGDSTVIFGRGTPGADSDFPPYNETVTPLP